MNENRREFVDRLLTFMGELNDPNARTVAEQLLNHAILAIWMKHPFRSFFMPDPYVLTTEAGTRAYILPSYFGRIASRDQAVRNLTTGSWIGPVEGEDLYHRYPEAGSAVDTARGDPSMYQIAGVVGVSKQVSSAGVALEVVSDSATDTDNLDAVIEGLDNDGVYTQSVIAVNGTTPVAAGTWTYVQHFSKGWNQETEPPTSAQALSGALPYRSSRGSITLRRVTVGTVYQTLLPHESMREHSTVTFWRTPHAAQSISVPILRLPRRLVNDADPLPSMWGPALFEESRILWATNTGELRASEASTIFRPHLVDLVSWDNELRSGGRSHTVPFGMA
jgi:hypothetical protein